MPRRWTGFRASFLMAGALLLLLAVVAVLQYRWIGEVSRAERARLRSSLETAAGRFAADLDGEIARAFRTFQPTRASRRGASAEENQLQKHSVWMASAPHPELIRALFLLERDDSGPARLQRLDPEAERFVPVAWPPELIRLRKMWGAGARPAARRPRVGLFVDPTPMLVLPSERSLSPRGLLIVLLDRTYIEEELLPELEERYFGTGAGLDYDVAVFPRDRPESPVYRSNHAWSDVAVADVTVELLGLRPSRQPRDRPRLPPLAGPAARGSDELRRPGMPREPPGGFPFERPGRGEWQLAVRHHDGSLEAVVRRARLRNLAISLGVLLLLGASIVMLAISERRAHRLAKQQMEFVAGVTHELNTPLAGIRSAAQNLADGVVGDQEPVRRYGAVIEKEGRRLSDMIQQVLEFAGIQSGRRAYQPQPLEIAEVVERALEDLRWMLEERGAELETRLAPGLPSVSADAAALRRVLGNLISNALKYGGGWVGISATAVPGTFGESVEIRIEDRGPGVSAEDRRRIFEPFYRGPLAAGSQTPGSGLGLSVVREIVQAHGGTVRAETRSEGGSRFTIQLPATTAPHA